MRDRYLIKEIDYKTAMDIIVEKHYLHRKAPATYKYGLIDKKTKQIVGVITYGSPASPTLQSSICGKEERENVIELTRLWTDDRTPKNTESYFISQTIKRFPEDIVVSFADPNQSHRGIVYQATNWIYTGKSSPTTKLIDKNGNDLHFRTFGHMRDAVDINKVPKEHLEKRRTNLEQIDVVEICGFLKKAREKTDYTIKQIDKIMGYKHAAGHWFRTDSGKSLPSVDDWWRLKKLLKFDDRYDDLMTQYEYVYSRQKHLEALGVKEVRIQGKHRYIFFKGSKTRRKELKKKLRLKIRPYPKK